MSQGDPDEKEPTLASGQAAAKASDAADSGDSVDSFLREAAHTGPGRVGTPPGDRLSRRALKEGDVVAKRYRLDRRLGEGGMGVVWAATHAITRRQVALKFLKSETDDLRRRFLREARAASAVVHPNVVAISDVFELEDETPVIVMDFAGETLGQRLARQKCLKLDEAAAILLRVASAVGTAHALGIVHRDLKPDNIFLTADADGTENVKVLDFGVAKFAPSSGGESGSDVATGTGAMLGTPCYMAPEQAMGERDVDRRADIWAVGIILYECLSGARPVKGSSVGQVVLHLMGKGIEPLSSVVPNLPADVVDVVTRMLKRERAERPSSLHEVIDVLARYTSVRAPAFGAPLLSPAAVTTPSPAREPSPSGKGSDAHADAGPSLSTSEVAVRTPRRLAGARTAWAAGLGGVALVAALVLTRARPKEVAPSSAAAEPTSTVVPVAAPVAPPVAAPPEEPPPPLPRAGALPSPNSATPAPAHPPKGSAKAAPSAHPSAAVAAPPAAPATNRGFRGGLAEQAPF